MNLGAIRRDGLLGRYSRPLVYAVTVAALVLFAILRARQVRREVGELLLQNVALSLSVTASDITAWTRSGQVQAELLARVLDEDLRSPRTEDRARYRVILRSLETHEGFVAGWMSDTAGHSLAAAGDTTVPPPSTRASGMTISRSRSATFIDFVAVVGAARVILRTSPSGPSFVELNPTRSNNLTGRTTLFLRRGDSVAVAATRSNGSKDYPATIAMAGAATPIAAAGQAKAASGLAPGREGRTVAFAVVPLSSPGWTVMREQSVDEVLGPIWWNYRIELAMVSTVVLLLVTFVNYWRRASRLRREHELTRIRADFVASVSHELRTPLAQIRMYAELLRKGSMRTPQDTDKALNVIEKEAHRLNILVDNVLNFTRLRRQTSQVPSVPTRVDDDITHVVEAFTPLARERSVCVEMSVEPDLTAAVDSLALRQILLNFLENAVKYGPAGQTVRVSASAVGARARICVDDSGPGVAARERDSVWQPFVRGAAAATSTTGSGIGLAVVRDLVLQHSGTYAIERAESGGARFVVEFPRFAGR